MSAKEGVVSRWHTMEPLVAPGDEPLAPRIYALGSVESVPHTRSS